MELISANLIEARPATVNGKRIVTAYFYSIPRIPNGRGGFSDGQKCRYAGRIENREICEAVLTLPADAPILVGFTFEEVKEFQPEGREKIAFLSGKVNRIGIEFLPYKPRNKSQANTINKAKAYAHATPKDAARAAAEETRVRVSAERDATEADRQAKIKAADDERRAKIAKASPKPAAAPSVEEEPHEGPKRGESPAQYRARQKKELQDADALEKAQKIENGRRERTQGQREKKCQNCGIMTPRKDLTPAGNCQGCKGARRKTEPAKA